MTETTQTPAPTLAQLDSLLAARSDKWDNFQCAPYRVPGYWAKKHQWDIACDDYAAAVTRAALNHDAMTDDDRATLANPPDHYASTETERHYAETLETWRAIVHPQEFDAQPA